MPVTELTFERIALEDPEGHWELHHGEMRAKPAMSFRHNDVMTYLGHQLIRQLDPALYRVRINAGHVRRADVTYYIPDVFIIPVAVLGPERDRPDVLETYDRPLPLVVEIWSPSAGGYDVDAKIPEYQRRGDLEIWLLHPFERTLTTWRRQPDGAYAELTIPAGGTVELAAIPGVSVDFAALLD
ncbi:MAG: Uma2 family endonuclease [Chloroflexota bacterium]|nr:Uma2 family endonuclease [Chloroflexota bacterium]